MKNMVCKLLNARHMGEPVLSLYDHLLSAKNTLDLKDELEIIEVRESRNLSLAVCETPQFAGAF